MKMRLLTLAVLVGILGGVAARTSAQPAPGLDLAGMDRAIAPGDDFFRYANGAWLKSAEIPADRSSWGAGAALTERTNA